MRRWPLLLLLLFAAPEVHAVAVRHELDPVHTRVLFVVSHAGFSNALGTISGSTGELWFDPEDWSSARLRVSVPIARTDLGDAKWNKATLARNLLDAERYPEATFVSTRIEPIDAQHARVFGTLTLRGAQQDIRLDVTLNAAKRHPLPPFRRTLGFSATATLSRKAFGIDAWPSVIGEAVELRIEAEAVRARGSDTATGEARDAAPQATAENLPVAASPDAEPMQTQASQEGGLAPTETATTRQPSVSPAPAPAGQTFPLEPTTPQPPLAEPSVPEPAPSKPADPEASSPDQILSERIPPEPATPEPQP